MERLPKRMTQDVAAMAATAFLCDAFDVDETVCAYLEYVEAFARANNVPAWPTMWGEGEQAALKHSFEFWCLWSGMMTAESYDRYVNTPKY